MEWRVCIRCWIFKAWDLFHVDNRKLDWHTASCKACRNEKKRQYRQTYQWQVAIKNYRVKRRADPTFREKEKKRYQERQKRNRERLSKYYRDWINDHPDRVKERRAELDSYYFRPGKKVYFWKLTWVIKEVKKRRGCLVFLENDMKIRIAKNRLKPFKLKSQIKKSMY